MQRSKRLQPVLDLARQKSREGMQAVAYIQHRLEEEVGKLEQLRVCQKEYNTFDKNDKKQSFNALSLRGLREFNANVEVAIQQQSRQVQAVRLQLQQVREQWRQLDARSQGLEKTQQKIRQEELRLQDRIEQRDQDEFIQQLNLNKPGISGHKPS
ncbi:MAG: hypothetical protein GKR91_00365 [Pseudomonadales bacterium]|nr:hypothetical protein [Pseudomonadales bacterium]